MSDEKEDESFEPLLGGIVFGPSAPDKRIGAKQMRRTMTPAEARLWQSLRANRLAGLHFRRQQVLAGFVADFFCHRAALIIEVDGPIHDQQRDYDAERDRLMTQRGLYVLRFTNEQVQNHLADVLAAIHQAAAQRIPDLSSLPPAP